MKLVNRVWIVLVIRLKLKISKLKDLRLNNELIFSYEFVKFNVFDFVLFVVPKLKNDSTSGVILS
jgi:hypothetical protein